MPKLDYTIWMLNDVLPDALFTYQPYDIQKFLQKKNCFLADYCIDDKPYADWLDEYSKLKNINPKQTLTNLQKEQSIIGMKAIPPDKILNRALGYGMTDSGDITSLYGFKTQNVGEIDQLSLDYDRYGSLRQPALNTPFPSRLVDDELLTVHPLNIFTSVLYKYTPWTGSPDSQYYAKWGTHGVYLFWTIWRTYWPEDLKQYSHIDGSPAPVADVSNWLNPKPEGGKL